MTVCTEIKIWANLHILYHQNQMAYFVGAYAKSGPKWGIFFVLGVCGPPPVAQLKNKEERH